MLFAHDTEVALNGAAALVNTLDVDAPADDPEREQLATLVDLDEFVRTWGWTGRRRHSLSELAQVRAVRDRLRQLWYADTDEVVALVNRLLAQADAVPQLVRHDDWGYHVHATPAGAPLADRMAVEAAMAFVDLVRGDELSRLGICAADDCANVLVDLSRNRSRRFCEAGCGNRVNVAAYRARRSVRV